MITISGEFAQDAMRSHTERDPRNTVGEGVLEALAERERLARTAAMQLDEPAAPACSAENVLSFMMRRQAE